MKRRQKFAVLAGLCAAGLACAQVRPPDAGTIFDSTRQPAQPIPQPPARVLPPQAPTRDLPADSERITVKQIQLEGVTRFPAGDVQALVSDVVGRTVSFGELRAAIDRITRYYEAHGYFLSRALIPAQDAQSGVIRVRVVEARYGEVGIDIHSPATLGLGLKMPKARAVLDAQGVRAGEPVTREPLERALYLLSELPGVAATTTMNPGAAPLTTDAQVQLQEVRPIYGQIGADTLGNRYTGSNRLTGSFGINSPFGFGDRLSLNGFTSSGSSFGFAEYSVPIGNDGLRFGVNGGTLDYRLCCNFSLLGAKGDVRTLGATLTYPLILNQRQNLWAGLSYERRHAVDDTFAGQTADRVINVATANLVWSVTDIAGGIYRVAGAYSQGHLDLSGNTTNALADAATAQTSGTYNKLRTSAARVQYWDRHQLLLRLQAQWAGNNLDSSEKLSLGGYDGVRAYPQGEAPGDQAAIATIEYGYTLPLSLPGRLQLTAFFDAGTVQLNHSAWLGFQSTRALLPNNYSLYGAGVGANWSLPGNFYLNVNVATKIGNNPGAFFGGQDADGSATRTRYWVLLSKAL